MPSQKPTRSKILFVIRTIDYFHYYRSIIEELCARGHAVELLFDEGWSSGANHLPLERACAQYSNLSWGWGLRRRGLWRHIVFATREIRSYRRYLFQGGQSAYYRERWLRYIPWYVRGAVKYIPGTDALLRASFVNSFLLWCEKMAKPEVRIMADIKKRSPDLLIAGPLNQRFAEEIEYVKAAKMLGIPSAGVVLSWDNLTTKGLIQVMPDVLLVWNEEQVKEAQAHHGIAPAQTRIIGAPVFDHWFAGLTPSGSREEFLHRHGLDPARPYVLYLGSSRNISHGESWVVEKLRAALDTSSNNRVRDVQIMVRPHGSNFRTYEGIEREGIVIVPKIGTLPSTEESLQLSYDSMYFAEAVININTSAMIEAMIIGKPVFAMMIEKYQKTQNEAQHFRQLLGARALMLIRTDEDLRSLLGKVLQGEDPTRTERQVFIRQFVRPRGLGTSAGAQAANIVEELTKAA